MESRRRGIGKREEVPGKECCLSFLATGMGLGRDCFRSSVSGRGRQQGEELGRQEVQLVEPHQQGDGLVVTEARNNSSGKVWVGSVVRLKKINNQGVPRFTSRTVPYRGVLGSWSRQRGKELELLLRSGRGWLFGHADPTAKRPARCFADSRCSSAAAQLSRDCLFSCCSW